MKIQIKRTHPDATIPEYKTPGAAAFDISVIENNELAPGEIYKFRTGLVFCVPKNYFLLLASRSSNSIKKGVCMANGIGVIDSDYCGEEDEVSIVLQNITDKAVTINSGDNVAQGIILPAQQVKIEEVVSTGFQNRGGFGSTGR